MGYLKIHNLYKEQTILLFKECYALEKIHGTSAHIGFHFIIDKEVKLDFFSGGEKHETFVALFDQEKLKTAFKTLGILSKKVVVFGEAYGGKCQGMSATYGKQLKFVAFDVQIEDSWLDVPNAKQVVESLGLEFVHYTLVPTDIKCLDQARDADSVQAIRNGVGAGKKMEGVILRPHKEMTLNHGGRVIAKHKRDEFRETSTPRPVVDPSNLKILEDAQLIANEWVTTERLKHVLDRIPDHGMEKVRDIIEAMKEDVSREAAGEIVPSDAVNKAIARKTVELYKENLKLILLV